MRARVGAVGGTLRAGPTPTGWAVELTVPLVQHTPDEGPGTMSR